MTVDKTPSIGHWIAAGIAMVFGGLTILSGGQALFGDPAAQAAAGDAVPFVLWFNFLSGFVYVLAGIGIALRRPWSGTLAIALAVSLAAVFAPVRLACLAGWRLRPAHRWRDDLAVGSLGRDCSVTAPRKLTKVKDSRRDPRSGQARAAPSAIPGF